MQHGYDPEIHAWQILTIVWLIVWVVRSIWLISAGDRRTVQFLQIVHFFFCGFPLILDVVVAPPAYPYQWGLIVSQYDHDTNLAYLALISWVPLAFTIFGGRRRPADDAAGTWMKLPWWAKALAWGALLAVPVTVVFAPDPGIYVEYAAAMDPRNAGLEVQGYQQIISILTSFAVIGGMLIIAAENTKPIERFALIPFLIGALWLHGKRSVVCLALMLLLYLLWMRGQLRGTRFFAAIVAAGLVFGGFSYLYQTHVRDIGVSTIQQHGVGDSDLYVNYRIDYGRDGVIKQTLFAELHPEVMHILDFRGQSMLFYATFFVPRSMWPEKPFPYAVYVTTTMLRMPPHFLFWGMTTSCLEEAIANFGWIGIIIGPLVPSLVCVLGDRRRSPFVAPLTLIVASLFLVVQLAAFMPIFLTWAGIMVYRWRRPV
jgi:hypothetical protein